jgi:hypothetical protein
MTNAIRCLAAALILRFAGAALAQTAPPAEPPPAAEPGTGPQSNCIAENDGYQMRGKTPTFVIELENKCEQRMRCKVFVYITSAKGPAQGRGTIVLAPKSRGAPAKKSYTMRAKMIGGSSQSARECRVF